MGNLATYSYDKELAVIKNTLKKLQDLIEELEDVKAYDEAKASGGELIAWGKALEMLDNGEV